MNRAGRYFDVSLREVHLKWGTTGVTDGQPRKRHELEAYIPISLSVATEFDLLRSTCFNVKGTDFQLRASGSQGPENKYGKNFESAGDLKLLGSYLKKELSLKPGCKVRVKWETDDIVSITKK